MRGRVLQWKPWLIVGLLLCVIALPQGCGESKPLRVGFLGGLTGRIADLGVAGRDGVTLAVEERNRAGGVAGRPLELVIRDDRQDVDAARQSLQELVDGGVVAVIGPMTSAVAVAVAPQATQAGVLMISPTVKTDQLTGLDDMFLRVTTPLSGNARALTNHILSRNAKPRIAVLCDQGNAAFTETWLAVFRTFLEKQGGSVVHVETFTSGPGVQFLPMAKKIQALAPDGILLLSGAIDSALFAQQMAKIEGQFPLYTSEWAFTSDLLSHGGAAVYGMTSFHSFNSDSKEPRYLEFKERFEGRFGYAPSFATVLAYDAANYLFAGLEKAPSRDDVKQALIGLGSFEGLQSRFVIDRYGDVERPLFQTTVKKDGFLVAN